MAMLLKCLDTRDSPGGLLKSQTDSVGLWRNLTFRFPNHFSGNEIADGITAWKIPLNSIAAKQLVSFVLKIKKSTFLKLR